MVGLRIAGVSLVSLFAAALASGQSAPTCPGGNPLVASNARYTNHADGTLTDINTGLTWKQCLEGLSGTSCEIGTASSLDWSGALQTAGSSSFAGASDWRLPNAKELLSLVETGCHSPSINAVRFPAQPSSGVWSSTTLQTDPGSAWSVEFDGGELRGSGKAVTLGVRLVRNGNNSSAFETNESSACAFDNPRTAPDSRFADNGDGTVTDSTTGLSWKRCVEGLAGTACDDGAALAFDWSGALQTAAASTEAGHSDWRLPNAKELHSLVDTGCFRPSINAVRFPATPSASLWTATTSVGDPSKAWAVDFTLGLLQAAGKSTTAPVRLVRGGSGQELFETSVFSFCASGNPRHGPDARYSEPGDGTIVDNDTGLVWKQCSEGVSGNGCATGTPIALDWSGALQAAAASTHAGHDDWRLPNAKELQSLVDTGCYSPSINTTRFPATPSSKTWTATTVASNPAQAWTVDFALGLLNDVGKSTTGVTRLVRGGMQEAMFVPGSGPICANGNQTVAPDDRYIDHGDGNVTDSVTGLTWRQCLEGLSGAACADGSEQLLDWGGALRAANASRAAGLRDWRLPNASELLSLVETGCHSPSINRSLFPGQSNGLVMTATTYVADPSQAWGVNFDNGDLQPGAKSATARIRLVRGGPSQAAYRPTLVDREVDSITSGSEAPSLAPVSDASGRYVVFQSRASTFVTKTIIAADGSKHLQVSGKGDAGQFGIYRIDTQPPLGSMVSPVQLVSVDQDGMSAQGDAVEPTVSADGQLIAFVAPIASMNKLWREDEHDRDHRKGLTAQGMFLRNMLTGTTQRVGTAEVPALGATPQIAPSGDAIVFTFDNPDPQLGMPGSQVMRLPLMRDGDHVVPDAGNARCVSCKAIGANGSDTATLADGPSSKPVVSADGRWVAWETAAGNSTLGSQSPCTQSTQIMLRDMLTGSAQRISAPPTAGQCGSGVSGAKNPSMDWAAGRIVFDSDQPLSSSDTNGNTDAFMFDVLRSSLTRISEGQGGVQGNDSSWQPRISGDGKTVAYVSRASNLDAVESDDTGVADIHVRQLRTAVIRRLARTRSGELSDGDSARPALNYNGTSLVFDSVAGNLTATAQAGQLNVFQRANPVNAGLVFSASFE